jgi:hypothetical protein
VTVERPLRLKIELIDEKIEAFKQAAKKVKDITAYDLVHDFPKVSKRDVFSNCNEFEMLLKNIAKEKGIKLPDKRIKLIREFFGTKDEMAEILAYLNPLMPQDKPRYLMGVGAPDDMINGVINGIDMFDCVYPTRNARHGTAMTTQGSIQIKNKRFEEDLSPLDPGLDSPISKYSKSYLRHLFK